MHQLPPLTAHEIVSDGLPVDAVIFLRGLGDLGHVDRSVSAGTPAFWNALAFVEQ
ncbi:hypothetical protein GS575_12000, partial [Rhodococcus hoagii]|nr:hypothetical protein [Prescottella equi]